MTIQHSKTQQELEILLSDYHRLIVSQAIFFIHSADVEDLIQTATVGAIKAFHSYDQNRGPLIPYLISCIKNELKDMLRVENRFNHESDIKDLSYRTVEHLDDFIPELNEQESQILKYKVLGYTRNEISKILDISLPLLNIKIYNLYESIRKANQN